MANGTPLTLSEREEIHRLLKQSYTFSEIARKINRGKSTVTREINRNGGPMFYDAVLADEATAARLIQGYESSSKKLKEQNLTNPYMSLAQRVENLEMQIEILLDVIKGMK